MELNSPPAWERYLLENPWPASLTLLATAVALVIVGRRRGDRRAPLFAAIALLAACAVFVLALLVETPREQMIAAARRLIGHTSPMQSAAFQAMLHPRATLLVESDAPPLPVDQIIMRLDRLARKYPITSQLIQSIAAESNGHAQGRTLIDLQTDTHLGPRNTRWLISWVNQNGQWLVLDVQWLPTGGLLGVKPSMGLIP
jgi:hypothetical protein